MQQTKTVRLLRIALDIVGLCALLSAALAIAGNYWFGSDLIKGLLLRAFFGAFIGGVIAFAAARGIELLGLAWGSSHESDTGADAQAGISPKASAGSEPLSEPGEAGRSVVTRMLAPRAFVAKPSDPDESGGGPRAAGGGHA